MFTKQQIIAALLEMQPGEMPAAVDPIASSEEIVHSISGAAAGCQATHIFSSPVIIEQAPKLANKTIEEKSGLEEPEVRYVLVEEAAPRQKAMEGDLGEFLRSHDLEAYTNVLENDHGITDVQTFTEMEKEDINLFCQVISHRIRFRKLLAELKGNSVNVSKQGSSSLLNDAGPPKFSSLRDFLQNRPEGRSILTHYEKHGELSNSMRNELVRLILLEGLNLKLTLDSKFHSLMTGKIVELFPGEKQETYYRASYFDGEGNRQPPCGKFIKRKSVELKALGLRGPKVGVQPDALHNVPGTSSIQSTTNEVPDVEAQAQAQNWLIHGRSPIEEVRRQWDLCFEKRKQDFQKEKDLSTIFQMYPIIQDPKGGVLICSDFERLHPEAERKFYLRFPSLHQKLRKHIEKVGETKAHESIYNEYMGATEGEYKNLLLCSFLPLILQTNYRVKGKWRPSVKEAQMSFILEVQTPSEVRRKINERIQYLDQHYESVSLQPQIVMVGSPKESPGFFVVFGGAEYKADNILHAICLCLQVSFVLNLEYAQDCKPVWMFIQSYLFGIYASVLEMPKVTRDLIKSISD